MDGYPQVYADYELHRFTTKLLKQDRYWAQCGHCTYRTKVEPDPGHPEHSVTTHLMDKHHIEVFPQIRHA